MDVKYTIYLWRVSNTNVVSCFYYRNAAYISIVFALGKGRSSNTDRHVTGITEAHDLNVNDQD